MCTGKVFVGLKLQDSILEPEMAELVSKIQHGGGIIRYPFPRVEGVFKADDVRVSQWSYLDRGINVATRIPQLALLPWCRLDS